MNELVKSEHYKNPLISIDEQSEHYEKNIENQISGATSECIICGKGIKSTSKHYTIVAGLGNYQNLIHKDEWTYASSPENKDGGFMGGWDIGTECFKRIKNIPNIKDYVYTQKKNSMFTDKNKETA